MDSTLSAATANAAANALADAGARRGAAAGLLIGALLGGLVSLAFLRIGLPGVVYGALFGAGLGSAIGASIAAKGGGWWRGLLATLIPGMPASFVASVFAGPGALGVLLVLVALGIGAGAWIDHSLEDLRLLAREESYRASCQMSSAQRVG